jgi:hypothetical protein
VKRGGVLGLVGGGDEPAQVSPERKVDDVPEGAAGHERRTNLADEKPQVLLRGGNADLLVFLALHGQAGARPMRDRPVGSRVSGPAEQCK